MRPSTSSLLRRCVLFLLFIIACVTSGLAQAAPVQSRITDAIDEARLTPLHGNTHPWAVAAYDRGAAPLSLPMNRMLLVLKRSPEQETALTRLLDEQQDKSSSNYHKWLIPEEFGKQFGPSDQDMQAVTSWLTSQGFQVNRVSKGRSIVEFSGTAALVKNAFHAEIRKYVVNGEDHWANAGDPQIPSALTPVVAGVWTLHNFIKKPNLVMSKERFPLVDVPGSAKPLATGSNGHHFLSPGDFAVIYGINPVYTAGIQGSNVTIAVVGRTSIQWDDIISFRNIFGLPSNAQLILDGPDPGNLGGGEEAEAVLDTTWSGAVAPNAAVDLVVSASTDTTDGVDLSELYIVDNNLADIMTESFGGCEANRTNSELAGISALAEQAAAQGITYLVASGDSGSAGCDHAGQSSASGPLSVNALASTAFNVAVGGTIFNENGHDSTYWSPSTTAAVTALKYIPENVWNQSCTSATCGTNANLAASGGGASSFVPKPSWQSGVKNVPNDGFRDVPDVSLTAASHDPYLICLAGSCDQGFLVGIGGTSASAPSFAGIMALVDQKVGGRVGSANYVLYRLAAAQANTVCNASSTTTAPASTCVFNDVTSGNNAVPGEASYGTGSPQYGSSAGYDFATGLGSVRVNNLVNNWNTATFRPSITTLTLSPLTGITHGDPVTVGVTVTPQSGAGTPAGDVSLLGSIGVTPLFAHAVDQYTLNSGTVATTTHLLPGGSNMIEAHYAGDATFAPSDSATVQVTVNAEPSTARVSVLTADSKGLPVPFTTGPYGIFVYLRADVAGNSGFGTPSGLVFFYDNGGFLSWENLNSQGNTNTPNGIFTFSPGAHAITATYNGDGSFLSNGPSAAANFTITKAATTTTAQSSPTTVGSGSTLTLTAIVDTTGRGNAPTGNVSFFSGGTQLLGSAQVLAGINSKTGAAQGSATFETTTMPNGQHSITAQYTDDANYLGSSSAPITVTVSPDFTASFESNTMNVTSPGSSGSLTLTITGQTGYTGTVTFSSGACQGLPFGATCSFSPPSVTGSGTTKITVTTTAPRSNAVPVALSTLSRWAAAGSFTLAGIFFLGIAQRRRRRWTSIAGLLVLPLLLLIVGCGGGGNSGGGSTPGTPVGSRTITVTASDGTFSHSTTFTLSVQ